MSSESPQLIPPHLDADAALWSDAPAGRPVLVLLHGYGSDERDLFGLVPHLPTEYVFAAPRAPLSPPWPAPGYSWYPIEGLSGRDSAAVTRAAVTRAAERLCSWLDDHAAGATSIGLLGFSQGAAIALQALRLQPERFGFALNLSGYASAGELPGDAVLAANRPPVFWGRGTHDDVIPAHLIAQTTEWLPTHSTLSGSVYPGLTHSVSQAELDDVRTFLEARLKDTSP